MDKGSGVHYDYSSYYGTACGGVSGFAAGQNGNYAASGTTSPGGYQTPNNYSAHQTANNYSSQQTPNNYSAHGAYAAGYAQSGSAYPSSAGGHYPAAPYAVAAASSNFAPGRNAEVRSRSSVSYSNQIADQPPVAVPSADSKRRLSALMELYPSAQLTSEGLVDYSSFVVDESVVDKCLQETVEGETDKGLCVAFCLEGVPLSYATWTAAGGGIQWAVWRFSAENGSHGYTPISMTTGIACLQTSTQAHLSVQQRLATFFKLQPSQVTITTLLAVMQPPTARMGHAPAMATPFPGEPAEKVPVSKVVAYLNQFGPYQTKVYLFYGILPTTLELHLHLNARFVDVVDLMTYAKALGQR